MMDSSRKLQALYCKTLSKAHPEGSLLLYPTAVDMARYSVREQRHHARSDRADLNDVAVGDVGLLFGNLVPAKQRLGHRDDLIVMGAVGLEISPL
jgi:hypothetical protein